MSRKMGKNYDLEVYNAFQDALKRLSESITNDKGRNTSFITSIAMTDIDGKQFQVQIKFESAEKAMMPLGFVSKGHIFEMTTDN